jgi:di/tricarboxylate transporter
MAASTGFLPVGRRQAHLPGAHVLVASLGVALSLLVGLGGGPAGLDDEARRTLAITILGLGLWGAFPQHAFWPSVVVIALVVGSSILASPSTVVGRVVQLYGASGVWTPLTGFLFAHAVTVSGLGRRLALAVVRRVGRRPSLVVLAVGIASILVAPLSPSTTAKAFLLVPICVGLVEAYGARPGSRFGAAVLLFGAAANNIGASMFLTATIPNFISSQEGNRSRPCPGGRR